MRTEEEIRDFLNEKKKELDLLFKSIGDLAVNGDMVIKGVRDEFRSKIYHASELQREIRMLEWSVEPSSYSYRQGIWTIDITQLNGKRKEIRVKNFRILGREKPKE